VGYSGKTFIEPPQDSFSKYVWSYLQKQDSKTDEQADDTAYRNAMVLLERYNLFVLESSSLVGRDKETGKKVVHTFYSTESYPIFMYNEGTWQKFYEPSKVTLLVGL
jgi:hypothetical protein